MKFAATRIGLEAHLMDLQRRARCPLQQVRLRMLAVQMIKPKRPLQRLYRRRNSQPRQIGGKNPMHGWNARMHPFHHRALRFVRELLRPTRHRQRQPPGTGQPFCIEASELARRRRGAEGTEQAGRMKPALRHFRRRRCPADTRHGFVSRGNSRQYVTARRLGCGGCRQGRGNDHGARMTVGRFVRIVEFIAMTRRPVGQRSGRRIHQVARTDQARPARGILLGRPRTQFPTPRLNRPAERHCGIIENKSLKLRQIGIRQGRPINSDHFRGEI